MKFKKMISTILCATVFFNSNYCSAEPTSWLAVCTIAGVVQTCVRFVLDGGGKIRQVVRHNNVIEALNQEVRRYGGFRTLQEIQRMICDIIDGRSRIKVYGQTRAKQQCFDALSGCMARMMRSADLGIEKQGNTLPYLIICDGRVLTENLNTLNKDNTVIDKIKKICNCKDLKKIIFASLDSEGKLYVQVKDQKYISTNINSGE